MTKVRTISALRFTIFVVAILLSSSLFIVINQSYSEGTFVYVSNGEDGNISVMKLDPETAHMKMVERIPAGQNVKHMALSPDNRFLYASIRSEPFSVISYSIDPETGSLTKISKATLPDNMVYISTDSNGRYLLSVSNNNAKIVVNKISINGSVQPQPVQVISTDPNPHAILVDSSNRFAYVPHLGNDKVKQFLFDEITGILTPNEPEGVNTNDGSGPRHLDFSPDNRFVYVSNEIDGTVNSYRINNKTGTLSEVQRISAMPYNMLDKQSSNDISKNDHSTIKDVNATNMGVADIHVTPNGKWLYVSERTNSTIAAFAIDRHLGNLTHIGNYATEKIPRGFNIDPKGNFVISAGEESGYLSVHVINQENGELILHGRYESGNNPNWVEIVDFK